MNRNTQQHFATTPNMQISRSKFDRSFTHKTSWNVGDLVPFFVDPWIMPGDTVQMDVSHVTRLMTPIVPVMDGLSMDVYFFFVPNRLLWTHFPEFMGENKTEPWAQLTEYQIPQLVAPDGGWSVGSLAEHLGYPTGIKYKTSALPTRAYCLIWNEFFRDENLKNPAYISMGDGDTTGVDVDPTNDYVTDAEKGACFLKVAKNFDYFTAGLPQAQKGPAVNVPLGDTAPVVGAEVTDPIHSSVLASDLVGKPIALAGTSGSAGNTTWAYNSEKDTEYMSFSPSQTIGLVVDLSTAVGATVNQIRQAFQIQKWYERNAIGGTRMIEQIRSHFGVTNPDFRLQRPEYLGGFRQAIQMNQVVQTDGSREYSVWDATQEEPGWITKDGTPQGNVAAYSMTSERKKNLFTHSFTEWGVLMGLMCCRVTNRTYQQGLNRLFSAKDKFDIYWPEFAHLGNMGIKNKEIFIQGTDEDEEIFAYQEAFAEYRYFPDIVTGEFRSNAPQSLDIWHYADYYDELPSLSSEWIDEDPENVKRTLAVQDHDMLMSDILCQAWYTRPMPLYGTPGLIDHY